MNRTIQGVLQEATTLGLRFIAAGSRLDVFGLEKLNDDDRADWTRVIRSWKAELLAAAKPNEDPAAPVLARFDVMVALIENDADAKVAVRNWLSRPTARPSVSTSRPSQSPAKSRRLTQRRSQPRRRATERRPTRWPAIHVPWTPILNTSRRESGLGSTVGPASTRRGAGYGSCRPGEAVERRSCSTCGSHGHPGTAVEPPPGHPQRAV